MISIEQPRRLIAISFVFAFLLGVLLWFIFILDNPDVFPIRSIKVHGHYEHVDRVQIEQLVLPHVQSSFFALDLKPIKHSLLTMPWLESVSVSRVWPDRLVIRLQERKPVAIWDSAHLMTADGVVFSSNVEEFVGNLPIFNGPRNSQGTMLAKYREFSAILAPLDLHIKRLQLTSSMVWSMTLDNDVRVMLGDNDMTARLQRFEKVYSKIETAKHGRAKQFDLRYGDGVAVK